MKKREECPRCSAGAVSGYSEFDYDGQTCHGCGWSLASHDHQLRDAQRYRWLVENACVALHMSVAGKKLEIMDAGREVPWRDDLYDDDVDAAIDAAIAQESADHRAKRQVDAVIDAVIGHETARSADRREERRDADS